MTKKARSKMFFYATILLVFLIVASGSYYLYNNQHNNDIENSSSETPTGYPMGETGLAYVMYNDVLYREVEIKKALPDGFVEAGAINKNDNYNIPSENLTGSHVEEGQKIFAADGEDIVYVEYGDKYRQFIKAVN